MGDVIWICQSCERARGSIVITYPHGGMIHVCPKCEWTVINPEGFDDDPM